MNENTGPLDFQGKVVQVGDYLIYTQLRSIDTPGLEYVKVIAIERGMVRIMDTSGNDFYAHFTEQCTLVVPYQLPRSVKRALDQHTDNAED
jgi:hypothetical protein